MNRLYGVILLLVAAVVLMFLVALTFETQRTKSWPIAQGKAVETKIDEHQVRQESGKQVRITTRYRPVVRYSYEVNGVGHDGDRYSFDMTDFGDRQAAENELATFTAAERIDVYYDPDDPTRSVLRPGFWSWTALGKHAALYIIPAFLVFFGYVLLRTPKQKTIDAPPSILKDS